MITVDEDAVAFRDQHRPTRRTWEGRMSAGMVRLGCVCGWDGTLHGREHQANREWVSHRDAQRKLSPTARRHLDSARAVGEVRIPGRSARPLLDRKLIEPGDRPDHYRITPVGRGVLIEHDRVFRGAL